MTAQKPYREQDHLQFVADMCEAGLTVEHYRGRWFWEGPAVMADDIQDVLSATKVRCQWDNMGLGWVVYPKAYAAPGSFDHEIDDDR